MIGVGSECSKNIEFNFERQNHRWDSFDSGIFTTECLVLYWLIPVLLFSNLNKCFWILYIQTTCFKDNEINNVRGDVIDVSAKQNTGINLIPLGEHRPLISRVSAFLDRCVTIPVFLSSKLIYLFFGYFDPVNTFVYNKHK